VVEVNDFARVGIGNDHVHMVPGRPCVIAAGLGLGVVMVDVSVPAAPVAGPPLHPLFQGSTLVNARVSDVGSDGRFLVASAPLPDGTGSAFFWDLGTSPGCPTAPTFLGNVPPTRTLFNSNGGSVVDPVKHVFYSMTGGGSVRLVSFGPLAAAAAASLPLNPSTQTAVSQINLRIPAGLGGGSLLLSDSALVVSTDIGPRVFARNPDGTLVLQENIQVNAAHPLSSFTFATLGPYLYWDATDPASPNAFVEQGIIFARKWASCPAANNADCVLSTHP
jgi:hypothetical protein